MHLRFIKNIVIDSFRK